MQSINSPAERMDHELDPVPAFSGMAAHTISGSGSLSRPAAFMEARSMSGLFGDYELSVHRKVVSGEGADVLVDAGGGSGETNGPGHAGV